jgi:MFS family permease
MAPFAAALHNRFGARNVTRLALLVELSALVLSLVMTKVWQLMLLWGVVVGIGTGMTALVLGATIATRWFSARRGLVIGILTASTATGQLVFLPLLANLTDHFGWRIALGLMCGMLGLAALAVSMVMRDHPGDVGLRPSAIRVLNRCVRHLAARRRSLRRRSARCAMPQRQGYSGFCSRHFSSVALAPPVWSRCI